MSYNFPNVEVRVIQRLLVGLVAVVLGLVPVFAIKYWFIGVILQKAWLFYGLTTILVLGYLLLIYLDKAWLPKINQLGWWWLALIAVFIITTFTSISPEVSFWGHFSRMDGLVSWIYYTLFGIVALGVLRNKDDWGIAIKGLVIGSLAVCLYAIASQLGWAGAVLSLDPGRIEGSLGNPVFLGGYLAVVLPLLVSGSFLFKHYIWKLLSFAAIILNISVLVLTFTRASWMGVFVAVIIGVTLVVHKFGFAKIYRCIFGIVAIPVLALLVIGWVSPSAINNQRSRILDTTSIELRFNNWQSTLEAIKERPLLGWGLENINIALSRHYAPSQNKSVSFQESHADRAHNGYLDFAASGGILVLAIFLGLLIGAFLLFSKRFKSKFKNAHFYLNLGFFLSLVSFAVYIFTSFHLITNILPFILAFTWFIQTDPLELNENNADINNTWWPGFVIGGSGILFLAVIALAAPAQAVTYANRATEYVYLGDYYRSTKLFEQALGTGSWMSNPIRLHSVMLASGKGIADTPEWNEFKEFAARNMEVYVKERPRHNYGWLVSGMYLGSLGDIDKTYIRKAEKSFEMLTGLSPNIAEPWFRWGEMYAEIGETKKAQEKFAEALKREPLNWVILYHSGIFDVNNGEGERGLGKLSKVYKDGYCPPFNHVYQDLSESSPDAQILSYEQVIGCDKNDQDEAFAIVHMALIYKEMGDTKKAIETAKKIDDYSITFQELSQFKKDLGLSW